MTLRFFERFLSFSALRVKIILDIFQSGSIIKRMNKTYKSKRVSELKPGDRILEADGYELLIECTIGGLKQTVLTFHRTGMTLVAPLVMHNTRSVRVGL